MAGKRFKKLKQQHDDEVAEQERKRQAKRDSADAISARIGDLTSDEDEGEGGDDGDDSDDSEGDAVCAWVSDLVGDCEVLSPHPITLLSCVS